MTQAPPTIPIETIPGSNPILLIAPHGVMGNDDNTGKIARLMAKRLACNAVINEHYERPYTIDPKTQKKIFRGSAANPATKKFDLNNIEHIEKYLKDDFLKPIVDFKNQITANQKATVVLIHGMDDANASDLKGHDVDIFIGIGLNDQPAGKNGDRLTFTKVEANVLENFFADWGEQQIVAKVQKGQTGFSGWDKNNLNQLFTPRNPRYNDDKVQSIQLEIKKTGFRDTPENIEKTAERLSIALAKLLGIDLAKREVVEEPAKGELILSQETQADDSLVEQAYLALADIFSRHYKNALLEAGRYIIEEFYGGDIESVKANKPHRGQSLNQLIKRFQGRETGSPSRSWFYNAVDMVVDEAEFGDVQTYGQLGLSHKILLLPLTDAAQKKVLIEETVREHYTVKQLKDRIAEQKPTTEINPSLIISRLIHQPERLFNAAYSTLRDAKSLSALPPTKITTLCAKAQEQKGRMEREIANLQAYIERYTELIQKLDEAGKKAIGEKNHDNIPTNVKQDTNR